MEDGSSFAWCVKNGKELLYRRIMLAYATSSTTRLYIHPNFDLAAQFVNRLPAYND